jgi:MFS transporter, GlpU family, inner membrane protein
LTRVFRPTYLTVFELTNEQLGICASIFGFVAIAAYIFGGFIADKFQPKNLIGTALILTSLGGFYLSTLPGFMGVCFLYGYWGFTSIFLLWAAMIKATRIWGGDKGQGKAFGLLDGGRGLVGALISTLAVAIFIETLGKPSEIANLTEKGEAFKNVLLMSSSFVALVGLLIFGLFKKVESGSSVAVKLKEMLATFKFPQVYLLAGIVFCAYSAYRLTDIIPQFAHEIGGMDEVFTSEISTVMLYGRAAVGFGLAYFADKTNHFNVLKIGFILIAISCILYLILGSAVSSLIIFALPTVMIALGVYAARVLYFSVIAKSRIPLAVTGSAVGMISVIGYTPDIYFGIVSGYFLDDYGYEDGFIANFIMVFCLALIGLFFVFRLKKIAENE